MKPKSNVNSGNTKPAIDKYTFGVGKKGPRILFLEPYMVMNPVVLEPLGSWLTNFRQENFRF